MRWSETANVMGHNFSTNTIASNNGTTINVNNTTITNIEHGHHPAARVSGSGSGLPATPPGGRLGLLPAAAPRHHTAQGCLSNRDRHPCQKR